MFGALSPVKALSLRLTSVSRQGWWPRAAPARGRVRHVRGQTSLNGFFVPTGASNFAGRNEGLYTMSKKDHRQRRRRGSVNPWLFKAIVWLGQAILWIVRFWFDDRE